MDYIRYKGTLLTASRSKELDAKLVQASEDGDLMLAFDTVCMREKRAH